MALSKYFERAKYGTLKASSRPVDRADFLGEKGETGSEPNGSSSGGGHIVSNRAGFAINSLGVDMGRTALQTRLGWHSICTWVILQPLNRIHAGTDTPLTAIPPPGGQRADIAII